MVLFLPSFRLFQRRKNRCPGRKVEKYDPTTHPRTQFQIGEKQTPSSISIEQVRDHLVLLSAFHALRLAAGDRFEEVCNVFASEYQRWAQVMLPELRAASVNHEPTAGSSSPLAWQNLPPLGVLMCWHAHMLNPRIFDQDCQGAYTPLRGIALPLHQVAVAIRSDQLPVALPAATKPYTLATTIWGPEDIAAAVMRQAKFIENMARINWLKVDTFNNGTSSLQKGIARYHAWLDLLHSTGGRLFLVPTLDIDLAWHTHQLQGRTYKHDTERLLGLFLDHNDNAGGSRLSDGLKRTDQLWKERYGHEYLY